MRVLVTGGLGFIASHTIVELLTSGHQVVAVDNLSNSEESVIGRVEQITGASFQFVAGDIRDRDLMQRSAEGCDACIHFAALKAVGESTEQPLRYYDNNVGGTISLLEVLADADVRTVVFSSSATVYGEPQTLPLTEDMATGGAVNPYGWSKVMMEQILADAAAADPRLAVALLRYFNPVGAHPSGMLGEDPRGTPNNLMPYVARVAAGVLEEVRVFGDDYPTPDGTGVRDYIHVVDLAVGHLMALEGVHGRPGVHIWNLGTGKGSTVLEVLASYEEASGRAIPRRVVERRPGDVAASYADVTKIREELGWEAKRDLLEMCRDSWRWQRALMAD